MSRKISAVIGANYGDEGKGRTVAHLVESAQNPSLIVRCQSGAQAGHTVVHGGRRHVFSHVGSGALHGCPTLLTRNFTVNPIVYKREQAELVMLGVTSDAVFIDKRCVVSTPIDALLNQTRELLRDNFSRHGSCGLGFGETWERHERLFSSTLRVDDLYTGRGYDVKLGRIEAYAYARFEELYGRWDNNPSLRRLPEPMQVAWQAIREGRFNWEGWKKDADFLIDHSFICDESSVTRMLTLKSRDLIFENAQGLGLDMDRNPLPHVTRARCGLQDVELTLVGAQLYDARVDAYYCTRTYATRHGAGPLTDEAHLDDLTNWGFKIEDATNKPNDWQGSLRFAPLSPAETAVRIRTDQLGQLLPGGEQYIALNCYDQAPPDEAGEIYQLFNQLTPNIIVGHGADSAETEITGPKQTKRRVTVGAVADDDVTKSDDQVSEDVQTEEEEQEPADAAE